tara:strand:+ start:1093 stop:1695 length:603 start_codon:yes stop_codon:yes gene_type:complete
MVSINTIGVSIYAILLITLHLVLPTKYLKRFIYGSTYSEKDKLKTKDLFFKPYGFRDITRMLKTAFLTPFMLSFYIMSIMILLIFDIKTETKMYRIYLLCLFLTIILYLIHSGLWMFDETGGIFGDSMAFDELEKREGNKKANRKRLMDYRKIYSPKWIMIFLLIPIYVTLFSQGVKFFKNEFLTLTIMGLFIFMTALFA